MKHDGKDPRATLQALGYDMPKDMGTLQEALAADELPEGAPEALKEMHEMGQEFANAVNNMAASGISIMSARHNVSPVVPASILAASAGAVLGAQFARIAFDLEATVKRADGKLVKGEGLLKDLLREVSANIEANFHMTAQEVLARKSPKN